MKISRHPAGAAALLLTAALYSFTPSLPAQQTTPQQQQPAEPSQPPSQQAQPSQPDQAQPGQQGAQETKTYAGKIMKLSNGNYALVTGQTPQGQPAGHFLDNQDEAKKYEGKQVTVTGTLELASNTIHVAKIEAA
jgi:hypothetical protein